MKSPTTKETQFVNIEKQYFCDEDEEFPKSQEKTPFQETASSKGIPQKTKKIKILKKLAYLSGKNSNQVQKIPTTPFSPSETSPSSFRLRDSSFKNKLKKPTEKKDIQSFKWNSPRSPDSSKIKIYKSRSPREPLFSSKRTDKNHFDSSNYSPTNNDQKKSRTVYEDSSLLKCLSPPPATSIDPNLTVRDLFVERCRSLEATNPAFKPRKINLENISSAYKFRKPVPGPLTPFNKSTGRTSGNETLYNIRSNRSNSPYNVTKSSSRQSSPRHHQRIDEEDLLNQAFENKFRLQSVQTPSGVSIREDEALSESPRPRVIPTYLKSYLMSEIRREMDLQGPLSQVRRRDLDTAEDRIKETKDLRWFKYLIQYPYTVLEDSQAQKKIIRDQLLILQDKLSTLKGLLNLTDLQTHIVQTMAPDSLRRLNLSLELLIFMLDELVKLLIFDILEEAGQLGLPSSPLDRLRANTSQAPRPLPETQNFGLNVLLFGDLHTYLNFGSAIFYVTLRQSQTGRGFDDFSCRKVVATLERARYLAGTLTEALARQEVKQDRLAQIESRRAVLEGRKEKPSRAELIDRMLKRRLCRQGVRQSLESKVDLGRLTRGREKARPTPAMLNDWQISFTER